MLANRNYYFTLAMENNLCPDYISEKIYNALLQVKHSSYFQAKLLL